MKAHSWVEGASITYQDSRTTDPPKKLWSSTCSGCGRRIKMWDGKTAEESSRLQKAYVDPDCDVEKMRRIHDA